ncbi:MAG: hypothetical protein ACOVPA_15360, partial [Rubrivivax sp.]
MAVRLALWSLAILGGMAWVISDQRKAGGESAQDWFSVGCLQPHLEPQGANPAVRLPCHGPIPRLPAALFQQADVA